MNCYFCHHSHLDHRHPAWINVAYRPDNPATADAYQYGNVRGVGDVGIIIQRLRNVNMNCDMCHHPKKEHLRISNGRKERLFIAACWHGRATSPPVGGAFGGACGCPYFYFKQKVKSPLTPAQ